MNVSSYECVFVLQFGLKMSKLDFFGYNHINLASFHFQFVTKNLNHMQSSDQSTLTMLVLNIV